MLHDALANESPFPCAMDSRPPLGSVQQRPLPPQRAVSGGSYGSSQLPKRPTLPSRLSNIRSASQPVNVVDLTGDGIKSEKSNAVAFLGNREQVVSSPDVIKIEDDEEERPAKRAKTSGNAFRAGQDEKEGDATDKADEVVPGSPLPSLPKTKPSMKRTIPRRHRFGIEPAARKAHGLDPPNVATRVPPPKKVLDFAPWTGQSSEDVLTETVIKAGFFDKPQSANQNESNSAKASIWPNLSQKNHHGLSMLGYLFTAVMEKRQAIGRCTAPSTFKPPPRVTVTDTKREAWLRDLANPDVPLRKQSRTIPHGIRGKLLMEQCLGKDIPLQRAVWLAKCVGANELRAFRRKGVSGSAAASGEAKWVREWTVHVEQFLESVIASCGQQEWQKNMNYAVKLATAFYTEKLLDAEHYLDWVVSSLAEASLERLPIWIVMAQIYWKDITMYGRRGKRLAESILEHLHQIMEANSDVNATLKTRLQKLVAVLAVSNRGCLIIPRAWEKYKYLLNPKPEADGGANTPANNITKRNERLAAPLFKTAANTRSPLLDLYGMLDSFGIDVDLEKLADRCLSLVPDISKLIPALLDWASTPFRSGIARVYFAANIIAQLHTKGHDTDTIILQYLSNAKALSVSSANEIHRVIVDLVRLEAFPVGRYLQWLITSGVLAAGEKPTCATSLIAALPTAGLPLNVLNTRKTLMVRLGYATNENTLVDNALADIHDAITRSSTEHVDSIRLPESFTTSTKFSICQQICAKLSSSVKDFGISIGEFTVARDMIEHVEDISSLADLITIASTTDNAALLATACDTINLHAESFVALGQFKRLLDTLSEQYVALRSQQPLDRTFILALTGLAQRVPDRAALLKLLGDDVAICEQQSSLAVCSPASDSLIGMHASSLDSDDDIDAVFASGNTMDDQLMHRVFSRIMQRAEKPLPPGPGSLSRVGGWLNQLRSVDGNGVFDHLVHHYLLSMVKGTPDRIFSPSALAYLVSSGSIALDSITDMAMDVKSPQVAAKVLNLLISDEVAGFGLHDCERYRFRLQQERSQADHADSLITLLRTACETPDFDAEHPKLIEFIIRCTVARPGSARQIFEDGRYSETLRANAYRIIVAVLQLDRSIGQGTRDLSIGSLVSMANPFSVRHCIEAMRYLKAVSNWNQDDEKALGDATLTSFNDHSEVWPQLLEFAVENTNRTIHGWAQDQLLCIVTNKSWPEGEDAHEHMECCLELLAVTNNTAKETDHTAIAGLVAEQLKDAERQLSAVNSFAAEAQDQFAGLLGRLRIMLHICVMHVHPVSDELEASKQARSNLLAMLCSLVVHPKLQTHHDVVEYLFDLSSTLSDSLSDVSPALQKLQSFNKLLLDPRLKFILSGEIGAADTDTWLALASQVHPPGSQQQRALSKHPSQQPQMSSRPLASPQFQQSPTQQHQHQRWPSQSGHPGFMRQDGRVPVEVKMTPFPLRRWEIMPDPTPVMGENDASLSLGLFGARKV